MKNAKTIRISAKCSDLFSAQALDKNKVQVAEYDGYVPTWLPNKDVQHYGDYVELEIEIATGQIVNWKKPTQAELKKTFSNEN